MGKILLLPALALSRSGSTGNLLSTELSGHTMASPLSVLLFKHIGYIMSILNAQNIILACFGFCILVICACLEFRIQGLEFFVFNVEIF